MELRERATRILASRWTVAALVVVGVAIRLRQYVHNRSLWWDEAALAINVLRRGFPDLLAVLDYNQSAPPLFLWLTRLAWQLLGESEPVLRLVPMLAGIASLPLFAVAARRLLKPWLVPLALAMFVCNDELLRYATEFKQYSGDVAIACGLLCLALRGPGIALAVCGSLAVWMSHASTFVLCGLGIVLLIDSVHARRTREVWSLVAIAGAWLSSFAVLYLVHLRLYMGHRYLHHFWEAAFAPFPPSTWRDLTWYGAHASELVAQSGMQRGPALVAIVIGAVSLWREHRGRDLALLLAPVVMAFLVSAARIYPLEGRFTLYLVPSVTLLITQGVAAMLAFAPVHRASRMTAVLAGVAIVIVILLPLPRRALRRWREPIEVSDARSVVAYLLRQREATDMVYVDASITPAYEYYSRADARAWMRGSLKPESIDRFVRDLVPGTVAWILFATGTPEQQIARAGLLARIEQKAERTEERCGAHAWLGRYRVR